MKPGHILARSPKTLVLFLARVLAVASGEGRASILALHAAVTELAPDLYVTRAEIGKILMEAGWSRRQWRERR